VVAGSDLLQILAGTYTVRIELISGSRTRLDYISYETLPNSGVDEETPTMWGSIKALYR
jgi:hypothetical protein